MPHQFRIHYTREEARRLLPQIRQWLQEIREGRKRLQECEARLAQPLEDGLDQGGKDVDDQVRVLASIKSILSHFHEREIQIKDIDRGLIDFPALIGAREVFLCWEEDEDDIEHWHELDSGFAGREPL